MANPYNKPRPETRKEMKNSERNIRKLHKRAEALRSGGIIGEISTGKNHVKMVEVAVKSGFYSDADIAAAVIQNAMVVPEPMKILEGVELVPFVSEEPLDKCAKARLLAGKYKKYSRTLKGIYHHSRFRKLTDKQCEFVFDIVNQLKAKWAEKESQNDTGNSEDQEGEGSPDGELGCG